MDTFTPFTYPWSDRMDSDWDTDEFDFDRTLPPITRPSAPDPLPSLPPLPLVMLKKNTKLSS